MNLSTLTACATCHQALTENTNGGRTIYRHPVAEDRHDAVPIDAGRLEYVSNRCHTCTDAPPVWNYHTGLIQIAALAAGAVETYNDQWHVCYRCAQFIEADDSDALTAHCAALMRWHPTSDQYTILHTLHRGTVLSREGRTLLTTTDWPPARITAEMLPKIRDRFTTLLRSSADLPVPINDPEQRRALANQRTRPGPHFARPYRRRGPRPAARSRTPTDRRRPRYHRPQPEPAPSPQAQADSPIHQSRWVRRPYGEATAAAARSKPSRPSATPRETSMIVSAPFCRAPRLMRTGVSMVTCLTDQSEVEVSAAVGASGPTNLAVRAPRGQVDERRIMLAIANRSSGGALSLQYVFDTGLN